MPQGEPMTGGKPAIIAIVAVLAALAVPQVLQARPVLDGRVLVEFRCVEPGDWSMSVEGRVVNRTGVPLGNLRLDFVLMDPQRGPDRLVVPVDPATLPAGASGTFGPAPFEGLVFGRRVGDCIVLSAEADGRRNVPIQPAYVPRQPRS
ncbi:MAG TPA: hypothetical protein VHN99_01320 [Deinococcales bacterium]|nr:hypothetical protein [Deinococcales bacterium]